MLFYSKKYLEELDRARKEGIDSSLPKHLIDEFKKQIRKEERERVFKKIGSSLAETPYFTLHPICNGYNWAERFRKNREAKVSKVLEDRLTGSGFFVHKEFMFPWLETRADIYATKGEKKYVFEVKTSLDSRGIGQATWYSYFIKKHFPEMKVFLAFPCYNYLDTMNRDFREFLTKISKEFDLGYCPISQTGLLILINKIENTKWFEVCRNCKNCEGFNFNNNMIPKNEIATLDTKLREAGYIK